MNFLDERMRSGSEVYAIKLVFEHSQTFAEQFPQISDDYRNQMTPADIAKKYDVENLFHVSPKVAIRIVMEAIRKLIPDMNEREGIIRPRLREAQSKFGSELVQSRRGAFGMTAEAKSVASSKSGKIGGAEAKKRGSGIFALTSEQRSSFSIERMKRQQNSWYSERKVDGKDEGTYAWELADKAEYQIASKKQEEKKSLDYHKICEEINRVFGNFRTWPSVKSFFETDKKKIGKEIMKAHGISDEQK